MIDWMRKGQNKKYYNCEFWPQVCCKLHACLRMMDRKVYAEGLLRKILKVELHASILPSFKSANLSVEISLLASN